MATQSVRQAARRAALDAQAKKRQERADREKRLTALGIAVDTALAERDGLIAQCEQRAGTALRAMIEDEGLSLTQALSWCGTEMSRREAKRLQDLAPATPDDDPDPAAGQDEPAGAPATPTVTGTEQEPAGEPATASTTPATQETTTATAR